MIAVDCITVSFAAAFLLLFYFLGYGCGFADRRAKRPVELIYFEVDQDGKILGPHKARK